MSGPHTHGIGDGLVVHRHGPLHGLPAHGKLLALLGFALVVVATPVPAELGSRGWLPYLGYALLLLAVVILAQLPPSLVARRSLIDAPFLLFAALMPFVTGRPTVQHGPLALSEAGLVGGLAIAAKATLGVVAAVVLAATTQVRDLLVGLERLRLPAPLVAIAAFMVRYVSVVVGDAARMRVARESRGYAGGRAGHLAAVAGGVGTLFVRSYERGERVQLAMASRGYVGRMPRLDELTGSGVPGPLGSGSPRSTYRRDLLRCALLPGAAAIVLVAARMMAG